MIRWKQLSDSIVITWEDIPGYVSSKPNTFQIEMYFDGRIQLSWLEVSIEYCVVGLSKGLGTPDNFQEIDFSDLSSSSSNTPGNVPGTPSGRKDRRK
jgi:hypothetical protein